MVVNFWEEQRKARVRTAIYVGLFIIFTLFIATIAEITMRNIAAEDYDPPIPYLGLAFVGITFAVAGYNYLMYRAQGGSYVAESIGAFPVDPNSNNPKEKQLINIVQELALATTLPMPNVYIIPSEEINAFAAGLTRENAAIAITAGALKKLNRDEVQGVLAHEFGHIYNGDMAISLRLAALIMGFFFILYLGLRLLQGARFSSREEGKGGNPLMLAALILMIAGALSWLMGAILKATVSRQREYLADASSVQFTRNPDGLANALRKIAKDTNRDMPKTGGAYSHMYLEDHTSVFATHPPIWKRIAVIEGRSEDSVRKEFEEE